MKKIKIVTTSGDEIEFTGEYLPERQKENWHYYMTDDGSIIHCRKEHMVYVLEEKNDSEH